MIERQHGEITLICDDCGDDLGTSYDKDDFRGMIDHAKNLGMGPPVPGLQDVIVAGSGHRLGKLYYGKLKRDLRYYAREKIVSLGATEVISGMAIGWDQAVALAAIDLQVPFIAVIPFEGMEFHWPPDTQAEFKWIRERAKSEIIVSKVFDLDAYQKRNEIMVDQAEAVMALWDGRKHGGTFNCLRYAAERGVRVHHCWQEWQEWQDRAKAILRADWPSR